MLVGFEIEFAKYSFEDVNQAPLNVIGNVKYKGPGDKFRPVVGGGAGLYSAWTWGESGGFDVERNWSREAGAHGVFGVEIGEANKLGVMAMVEVQRVFEDDAETSWVVLGGIYF